MFKNIDPMELERTAIKAMPALVEMYISGWFVRLSKGYRLRWNCAIPFENFDDTNEAVAEIEAEFEKRNVSPCIKIFQNTPPKLASVLESRGYDASNRHHVYARELESFISRPFIESAISYDETITDKWKEAFCELSQVPAHLKSEVLETFSAINRPVVAAYYTSNYKISGTSLGILVDDYVYISSTVARQRYQNREADKALFNKVLERAQAMGAKRAFVQALSTDSHNINIYQGKEFVEVYSYIFRKKVNR